MREFGAFVWKQVQASIFAFFIFAMLAISHFVPFIPRYDFMLITCLAMQVYMVRSGLETKRELVAVSVFHLVGLALELYKVRHGSWSYPEFAYTKFGGVPLYSGFMYASVASYIFQAYRVFDLEFTKTPKKSWALIGVGLIYLNFFTNQVLGDQRIWLILCLLALFVPSVAHFTCAKGRFRMPLAVSFGLIGFFVWVGENVCTFLGAWVYPNQVDGWELVHASKIGSWSMMVMVAFVIIWTWRGKGEDRSLEPAR